MAIAHATYPNDTAPQRAGLTLALVIALHAGAVAVLLSFDVLPLPSPMSALMVRLIQPSPEQPENAPPRPKPVTSRRVAPSRAELALERPLLAAEAQAPTAIETPASRQSPPAAPQPVVTAGPPVATISAPRFDAAYLDNPAPIYPALSRRMREEGRVVLRVFVEASGRSGQVEIQASSGSPRLDQAAQDAVSRWKFFPAQRGAEAVGAWVLVPIVFNLRG